MASPVAPTYLLVERLLASVAGGNLAQKYVSPIDCDIVGLMAIVGTAPGGSSTVTINASNSPTSQLSVVSPYTLWSAAAVPTITGAATASFSTILTNKVVENIPYALNYPLPGPPGTSGLVTAQQSLPTVESPLTAPPFETQPNVSAYNAPDATYIDMNGFVRPTNRVRTGDVLTFVIGGTVGSAANLEISLLLVKH